MTSPQSAGCAQCPPSGAGGRGLTRRSLLAGAAAVVGGTALDVAAPRLAFGAGPGQRDLLVVVSLRGGADALSLVPPVADPAYAAARPSIGVHKNQAHVLDRTFGLHPGLGALLPWWRNGSLAVVHAVGDADGTRSHFEATDALDRGVARNSSIGTGWIDRHLTAVGSSGFPAWAVGSHVPGSLRGPAPEIVAPAVDAVSVRVGSAEQALVERALREMHDGVAGAVAASGRATTDVLRRVAPIRKQEYVPREGVTYPGSDLGHALREVARVARAGVGLGVACVSSGGWDTHTGMGGAGGGSMASHVKRFGDALAAFAGDLGPLFRTTTIVTVSEFGRRLAENDSGGVDHGHGGVMLLLGGGVRGGRVYGRWPGLAGAQLDSGDLRVTTDYRDVLGEVVRRRLGNGRLDQVFPGHRVRELGALHTR
jgi:uncharacterized protein (DUF1501 family)